MSRRSVNEMLETVVGADTAMPYDDLLEAGKAEGCTSIGDECCAMLDAMSSCHVFLE